MELELKELADKIGWVDCISYEEGDYYYVLQDEVPSVKMLCKKMIQLYLFGILILLVCLLHI